MLRGGGKFKRWTPSGPLGLPVRLQTKRGPHGPLIEVRPSARVQDFFADAWSDPTVAWASSSALAQPKR